jgi:hypothetical protein
MKRQRKVEDEHQKAVIQYLRYRYPPALFTIAPNGFKLPIGVAVKMKAMGYKAGTPDIMIFEPRGQFHGLFIEMKRPAETGASKGVLSFEQKAWNIELNSRGYMAIVSYGSEMAIKAIDYYLKGGTNAGN